ncbi:MAG: PaaI family thioesterase [Peptostreptococcaceae bacterium]|nr:PaaI family thioesterase [Peptostreptococcaceae bacterium]
MDGQRKLMDYGIATVNEAATVHEGTVNGMIEPAFMECSFEQDTITISFRILKWETNRIGILHGGITAAAFDYTMGILARFYSEMTFCPTVSLEMKYIRPVELGEVLIVKARAISKGRKVIHLTAEGTLQSNGKVAASGAAIFLVTEKRT